MFGNAKRNLQVQIDELKQENKKLKWLIQNPCPYKVGEKIKGLIITEVYLFELKTRIHTGIYSSEVIVYGYEWRYKTLNKDAKPKI
jgi:hypothetical protein